MAITLDPACGSCSPRRNFSSALPGLAGRQRGLSRQNSIGRQASRQPFPDPAVMTYRHVVAPLEVGGDRHSHRRDDRHRSYLLQAGLGVHARWRRVHPLHAHTMPGISITEAQKILQVTDRIIKQFPEVDWVLGKAGRRRPHRPGAAVLLRRVIILKPKSSGGRRTSGTPLAPEWRKVSSGTLRRSHLQQELIAQMNEAVRLPALPIRGHCPSRAGSTC